MSSRCDKYLEPIRKALQRRRERIDLKRENNGELDPYRRLIVITGMARSGTSVTAAFVGSHPDVRAVIGGGCWDVVETDLIRPELGEPDWESIDEVLRDNYPHRVLLKQPWMMTKKTFLRAIRPAKVLVCLRDRRNQIGGWQNSRDRAGDRCASEPGRVYEENILNLPRMLKEGATWVYQDQMDETLGIRLGKYLGLKPEGFDNSILERRWREKVEKDWFEKHSIRKERRP